MTSVHEQLSDNFYRWEMRGRGVQLYELPVFPEPPFLPFLGYRQQPLESIDDGRQKGFLSSLIESFAAPRANSESEVVRPEPAPVKLERFDLVCFQTTLLPCAKVSRETVEHFFGSLRYCREPITFELIGTTESVISQWVSAQEDSEILHEQLEAHFPDALHLKSEHLLERPWITSEAEDAAIIEFGLEHEFMVPINCEKRVDYDPFIALIGALSELGDGEVAVYQVIFQPVRRPWSESILDSVRDGLGKSLFVNRPELVDNAQLKTSRPLFGVILRIAIKSNGRLFEIARNIAGAMATYSSPGSNEIIPLDNSSYDAEDHQLDLLFRQTHRSGMLLNSTELASLAHPPSASIRSAKLIRDVDKTKAAPQGSLQDGGLILGSNAHAGVTREVFLSTEQRVRHTYVIGASGTGKSTFLFNLIAQDLQNNQGLAVFDPHGDLVDQILGTIPEDRIKDVIFINPADETHSIGFNILSVNSELEKNLLASDLVSVFQRLSTSWGDQMTSVLNNAILAFLESEQGGTLVELQRFLIETSFRKEFLATVQDEQVIYYWQKIFPQLTGNKSIGPIVTRLGSFLDRKPIRRMVAQKENRLDFADIMDSGKIFLARLPQGQIGNENAYLLGSFLVSKFQQTVMSRQARDASLRRDFWMYIDEFHHMITPSMAEILTGARKYRLGLTLAHQELSQIQRDSEVASAALSNPCTRICFRVGDDDARKMGAGFSHFDAQDIQKLPNFHAICRIERADCDFNLALPKPVQVDRNRRLEVASQAIEASRQRYAKPIDELEHKPSSEAPPEPVEKLFVASGTEPGPKQSPNEPGKGGEKHRAIQQRLKSEAEELGFGVSIEKEIPDTKGESIDVVAQMGDLTVACEICVSTSIDHELGNVRKCLRAGYLNICAICLNEKRLDAFRATIEQCLTVEEQGRVHCLGPEHFQEQLKRFLELAQSPISEPQKNQVLGKYQVTAKYAKLDEAERRRKEEIVRQIIIAALKYK